MDFKELQQNGWIEIKNNLSDDELISFAHTIGKILLHPNGIIIDTLTPKKTEDAIKNTFSNLYGHNKFPLHTDTAFWTIPARYVIMSSSDITQTSTTVISVHDIYKHFEEFEIKSLNQAIYLVKANNKTFYTKLKQSFKDEICFRYDSCTMKPFNSHARKIDEKLNLTLQSIETNKVLWDSNKVVVIDNWKALHGRESISDSINRKIKRIYIQ